MHGKKAEAEARLAELLTQFNKGININPEKLTFGEFLDKWLADYARRGIITVRQAQKIKRKREGENRITYRLTYGTPKSKTSRRSVDIPPALVELLKRRAGLDISFHDLRHCHASWLIRMGESLKVVSARLGHSGIGITADLYAHLFPDAQKEAARKIDSLLADKLT